jgi:hypothetical protein
MTIVDQAITLGLPVFTASRTRPQIPTESDGYGGYILVT